MAQKKKTNSKMKTAKKAVYRVDISRTYSSCVYVKAESPEAAERLAEASGAADLSVVDERGDWGDVEYMCDGDECNDEEPDIGADDEPDEPAEEEGAAPAKKRAKKKKARTVDPAVVEGILASMVPIPGKDFKMGKFPVTQAQWEAVMGENPSEFKGADRPVENVSWDDCQKFLKKLNALPAAQASGLTFRLPEEDEWEFACRAGAEGDYCKLTDGMEITEETLGEVAWFGDESDEGEHHPVGQKKPNAFGLYDMHGNVCEWTNTAVGVFRVFRGGCCLYSVWSCRSSDRNRHLPSNRSNYLGFRLCADRRAD